MGVPENIDALLIKYDINQDCLARIADVAPSAITRWRQGAMPRKNAIANICNHFGLEEDDILSDKVGLAAKEHGMVPDLPGSHLARAAEMVRVPVLGRVHAGPAGEPDVFSDAPDEVEIPACFLEIDPDCFVLDYEGDCMSKDFGDTTSLVVSPNSSFGNDSIVVVVIDDTDYVVRRMEQNAKGLILKPNSWNPEYEVIFIPHGSEHKVDFKGKALGCFRRFD